jgi:hypothetical protein
MDLIGPAVAKQLCLVPQLTTKPKTEIPDVNNGISCSTSDIWCTQSLILNRGWEILIACKRAQALCGRVLTEYR